MKQLLKEFIKRAPLPPAMKALIIARRQKRTLDEWERNGRPVPPPHIVKQRIIRDFAKGFGLKVLVETGTYYGDMVEAMKPYFNQIYSIELSRELYEKAKQRFDGNERIKIIHGDSGIELSNIVAEIIQPALFWLDGHYSAGVTAKGEKDTPIFEELTHIFNSQQSGHVIIIDDARCFGTDPAYPSIAELSDFIRANNSNANIEVENDSIRITPSGMNDISRENNGISD
jgi:hypothetical protein